MKIVVLGAGVIGLTTAIELQKEFRNAQVEVIADKFIEDTTSHVAAGIFRPGTCFSGPDEDTTRKWINDSYYYWEDLKQKEGFTSGVTNISGHVFSTDHEHIVRNEFLEKLLPVYRRATKEELEVYPGTWNYGSYFTTLLVEAPVYLPWATRQIKEAGGVLIEKSVKTFGDLPRGYDVVMNCTGLGAKTLVGDRKLVPIRGQVIKVEAPWVKTFFFGNFDTYVIPGFNSVTLGGCRQYDSYSLDFNKYDYLAMKERCESAIPSLRGAKILKHCVGLRPHRDPVRVQKEVLRDRNGDVRRIVHNYGHGQYGWTTAPGTVMYACGLAKELLIGNSKI